MNLHLPVGSNISEILITENKEDINGASQLMRQMSGSKKKRKSLKFGTVEQWQKPKTKSTMMINFLVNATKKNINRQVSVHKNQIIKNIQIKYDLLNVLFLDTRLWPLELKNKRASTILRSRSKREMRVKKRSMMHKQSSLR